MQVISYRPIMAGRIFITDFPTLMLPLETGILENARELVSQAFHVTKPMCTSIPVKHPQCRLTVEWDMNRFTVNWPRKVRPGISRRVNAVAMGELETRGGCEWETHSVLLSKGVVIMFHTTLLHRRNIWEYSDSFWPMGLSFWKIVSSWNRPDNSLGAKPASDVPFPNPNRR